MSAHAEPLDTLDRYDVGEVVYAGTNSVVHRGRRRADDLPVFLKRHRSAHPTAAEVARCERDFALGRRAQGEGTVAYLDLVRDGAGLAVVTGDTGRTALAQHLTPGRALDVLVALRVGAAIARSLAAVHARGVVHGDIKPQNIITDLRGDEAPLVDFGAASTLSRLNERVAPADGFGGTLAYVAPEQTGRMNRAVDARADLYALGVTLFELLTGTLPFPDTDPLALLHAHLARIPPRVDAIAPGVDAVVADLVARLLAKDPDDRYQTASGVADDLARCVRALRDRGAVAPFALGATDVDTRLVVSQRLYGREAEVAALVARLDALAQGASELVLISGAPGIGKSALLDELERPALLRGAWFVHGRFEQFRRDIPLAAFGDALRALLRALDAAATDRADRVRAALREGLRRDGRALFPIAPELEALLPDAPELEVADVATTRARLFGAVREVLRAFASAGAGTVLVIDDLQWADETSLQLLRALAEDAPRTLVLGAMRDGEVDDAHPLAVTLRAIEARRGEVLPRVSLGPLREGDVAALLGDALRVSPEAAQPLAAAVHARTAGNPFFVRRLVFDLHARGALRFDTASRRWTWDLAAVDALDLPDNVVALLRGRMSRLSPAAREVLQVASCLGAEESVGDLAAVCDVAADALRDALDPSLEEGFVRLVSGGARYRFVHDRVQQAAWESVPEGERAAVHRRVGMVLLRGIAGDDDPRVVSAVAHLDEAGDDGATLALTRRLAALGLAAARRAVSASAFDRGAGFVTRARARMGPDAWRSAPEAALEAATLYARCLRALADHDGLAALVREVEAAQPDPLRLAPIYVEYLRDLAHLRDPREALAIGRRVLARFGVELAAEPTVASILPGVTRLRLQLLRRAPARIEDLSPDAEPRALVELDLLNALEERAWVVSPMHAVAILVQMALRASRCGRTAQAGFGWVMAAMAIMAVFNDAALAERLGVLGRELLARRGRRDLFATGSFSYYVVIAPWRHDLATTLDPLAESWRAARDAGDAHMEAQIPEVILFTRCFLGHDCATLRAEGEALLPRVRHDPPVHLCVAFLLQYLRCLQGDARDPSRLVGEVFDLGAEAPREKDQNNRFGMRFHDLLLAVYLGDAARKAESLRGITPDAAGARDTFMRAMFPLYAALAALDAEPITPQRRAWLRVRLRLFLRDLQAAEALHPPNVAHRTALLRAELARVEGRDLDALREYAASAKAARERGWHHEAGLAHERAARFHLRRTEESAARAHLEDALYHYQQWGARAKVDALRAEFPRMLALSAVGATMSARSTTGSGPGGADASLDVLSVTRGAQALSGVIERRALVLRLLELTAENAGARRGALVTLRDGAAWVEAAFEVTDDARAVRPVERPLGESDAVPRSVVAAVLSTRAPRVIDDAQEGADASLRARGTRSLLAVPLLRQGEVTGAMVLENDLAAGVFTPARVSVIEVLASQAAISLENARLYADLQRALAEQVALTEANLRFVPREFIASLGRTSITSVALGDSVQKEMTVLFSDMRGFSTLVEGHAPEENIAFINEYLAAMEPAIVRHKGFVDSYIGDAILALFEGAPGDAVAAGVDMLRRLDDYNAARAARGRRPVRIGIGVNTGTLTLGTIGGPQRIKCGVIGDPVNLGARIETATKQYGVPFLVGEESIAGLEARFALREVDRVKVRGRVRPVTLWEVFDADPEPLREAKRAALPAWREALEAWRAGDVTAADDAFARCARCIPDDPVLALRRARCAKALADVRPDPWTDVVELSEK